MHKFVMPIICLQFLAACAGTHFRWEDTERIKPGMSEAEVISVLGEPYSKTQSGQTKILTWSYAAGFGGAKAVSYRLVDDKVISNTTINKK